MNKHTSIRFETLVAIEGRSGVFLATPKDSLSYATHLNEMPY
jgi:hypothetical protein